MTALTIKTTDTQLHDLDAIQNGARKGSDSVRVPIEALRNLLADHYTLYAAATGPSVKIGARRLGKGHRVAIGDDQKSISGESSQ